MLTSLELENFKGIASRQRIDFAPLTLLFGANSAGKSTILQALLYLHDVIDQGSADVDRTRLGGNVLELGGFLRLVHRHDAARSIILRAEFATPLGLDRFGRDLQELPFPDLDDQVENVWLELTISFRSTPNFRGPIVDRAVIGVVGDVDPLVELKVGASLREGEPLMASVNLGHRLLPTDGGLASDWSELAIPGETGFSDWQNFDFDRPLPLFAVSRSRQSALPAVNEPLRIVVPDALENLRAQVAKLLHAIPATALERDSIGRQVASLREQVHELERIERQVRLFLEMVVIGTTAQLLTALRDVPYIGPLRTIPPRGFLYERAGRVTSWADGLAAWDLLLANRGDLVDRTNEWLKRLGAGCQIQVQQLYDERADAEELADRHFDKTVRRLLLGTDSNSLVLPSEVGAGVSQIIPVVVATLAGGGELCLVEQPEIHVHPAVQVGLGDLLIDAAARDGGRRTVLVETHSEHLLLRVLRRIRETTEGRRPDDIPAITADKISILYVESGPDGVTIRQLRVDEQGEFRDRWPKGFFAERMEEL